MSSYEVVASTWCQLCRVIFLPVLIPRQNCRPYLFLWNKGIKGYRSKLFRKLFRFALMHRCTFFLWRILKTVMRRFELQSFHPPTITILRSSNNYNPSILIQLQSYDPLTITILRSFYDYNPSILLRLQSFDPSTITILRSFYDYNPSILLRLQSFDPSTIIILRSFYDYNPSILFSPSYFHTHGDYYWMRQRHDI